MANKLLLAVYVGAVATLRAIFIPIPVSQWELMFTACLCGVLVGEWAGECFSARRISERRRLIGELNARRRVGKSNTRENV